jgi:S-DNA-T family DNA segregation ATPase FtsK/SpoIIIE
MAKSRRTRRSASPGNSFSAFLRETRENFSREALGGMLLVLGGYFALSLLAGGRDAGIYQICGWTAPLVMLGILGLGLVIILDERAGYWNPEALIGGELTMLAMQTGTFLLRHNVTDWTPLAQGQDGGLIGWAIGNLLLDGLGKWPALILAGLLLLLGMFLLYRHTPLIYTYPYPAETVPLLRQVVESAQMTARDVAHRLSAPAPEQVVEPTPAAPEQTPPPLAKQTAAPAQMRPTKSGSAPPVKTKTQSSAKAKSNKFKPFRAPDELPPIDLLRADSGKYGSADTQHMAQVIKQTLADFNVPVEVISVESGPTVTQFGLQPQYIERAGKRRKVRVNRIVNLADDLALALAAPAVRIEAPVPGRPYVGVEVPNRDKSLVGMRGILESPEMRKQGGALPLALGRDTSGAPVVTDLTKAPHLLIAGATGSGKSVCINSIITALLMHHGPESLRLIMVDPKMVELPGYNGIPHLIGKVITDMDQVVGALTWLLLQMDDRYQLFREHKVRNITAYNEKARKRKNMEPLPYIVLVVDELADLMMTAPEEIERQLCRLAQMARATGIHLILATQRPSTDVVTGLIKANFPTRIAFAVTSQIDSRVILDTPGAEKLLGQGDMLFMRPDAAKLFRVQGCFVSDEEIRQVVNFWKERDLSENPDRPALSIPPWIGLMDRMDDEDELLQDAIDVIRGMQTCSTSLVQRKLRIGYPKAARIMEQLEAKGIVGPDLGGGQGRPVLLEEGDDGEDENQQEEAYL